MDGGILRSLPGPQDYLSKPPLLSSSVVREDLFLYLAVSQTAVNSTLIREEHRI